MGVSSSPTLANGDADQDNLAVDDRKGLPPWAWIGCGCLGVVVAFLGLAIVLGLWGLQKAREIGEQMADPEERTSKALQILGAEEIPDGYHALVAFSVPFVIDAVVLSHLPPAERGPLDGLGERGFLYASFPGFVHQDREIRDFLEGRSDDVVVLREQEVDVDLEERVSRGALSRERDEVLWACHRGSVETEEAGRSKPGLVTILLIDCDDDSRRRMGLWFGPDPAPERPAEEIDLRGSVGDAAEIERFLGGIRPCR
jgi:hypothetical protein